MFDYLFANNETGDYFFVECDSLIEAWSTIDEIFGKENDIAFLRRCTPTQAERLGYDTY